MYFFIGATIVFLQDHLYKKIQQYTMYERVENIIIVTIKTSNW